MRLAVMAATHLLPIIFLKNTNYKDFLMETCKGNTTIGVFIDGGYYAKINEALMGKAGVKINLSRLFEYICSRVAMLSGSKYQDTLITECHYFRGRYRASDAAELNLLYEERAFEDSLIENDVVFHYKHLRKFVTGGETDIMEKGIDVWFALEAYELSMIRKFDYVVLVTGDADHEMLARKLNAVKIKTVLLTWNLGSHSSTSRLLHDEAWHHIELKNECKKDASLMSRICDRVE